MEAIWFTLTGIALYLAADALLQRLEVAAGRRFEYRTLIFFGFLLGFALVAFPLIRTLIDG